FDFRVSFEDTPDLSTERDNRLFALFGHWNGDDAKIETALLNIGELPRSHHHRCRATAQKLVRNVALAPIDHILGSEAVLHPIHPKLESLGSLVRTKVGQTPAIAPKEWLPLPGGLLVIHRGEGNAINRAFGGLLYRFVKLGPRLGRRGHARVGEHLFVVIKGKTVAAD